MAGYSSTPLPQKLGIRERHRVALLRAPRGFAATLTPLPAGVTLRTALAGGAPFDVVVAFCPTVALLERSLPRAPRESRPT